MTNTGWIKLYRNITEWEWYNHTPTKVLFLHLLLKATSKARYVYNQTIQQGQYITTVSKLSTELNLTAKQVRTALNNLRKSKNIDIKTSNKYTLITIIGFEKWQKVTNITKFDRQTEGNIKGTEKDTQRANKKTDINTANNTLPTETEQRKGQAKGTEQGTQKARDRASIEQEERIKNKEIYCCSCNNIYIPSLKDIQEYINNNNYTYKAEYFYNYYKAKDWQIGKARINNQEQLYALMDNWQAKENKNLQGQPQDAAVKKNSFTDYNQKIYSEDEIEKILSRKILSRKKEGG